MSCVLLALAVGALCLGIVKSDVGRLLSTGVASAETAAHGIWLPVATLAAALSGVVLAWFDFGRARAAGTGFVARRPAVWRLFHRRWYLDDIYRIAVAYGIDRGLALLCAWGDRKVIDPGLDGLARATVFGGRWLARLHTAGLQSRLMFMFAAVGVMVVYLLVG